MALTPQRVEEFKRLYELRFGGELRDEETIKKAEQLLQLVRLTYQPMRKSEYAWIVARQQRLRLGDAIKNK